MSHEPLDKPIHEPSILIVKIQQQPNYTEFVKQIKDKKEGTESIDGYPSLAILNDKNWEGIFFLIIDLLLFPLCPPCLFLFSSFSSALSFN